MVVQVPPVVVHMLISFRAHCICCNQIRWFHCSVCLASEGGSGAPTAGTYVSISSTIRAFAASRGQPTAMPRQRD